MLDKIFDGVSDVLKTAPTLYEDGFKPTVSESGKAVSIIPQTVNSLLVGLRKWNLTREYNYLETESLLKNRLLKIQEDKLTEAEPFVAIPALMNLSYCMDNEELRNLYANLLSNSMNIDTKHSVHPAFIDTIKQLSPNDAKYFKKICQLETRPMFDVDLVVEGGLTITVAQYLSFFSAGINNLDIILSNLSRLGLIDIPDGVWYGDDNIYRTLLDAVQKEYIYDNLKHLHTNSTGLNYVKKRIDITAYGKSFYDICVKE